jgi:hypothetical protein
MIAAVRDALPLRLRISDGREYLLGTPRDIEELRSAIGAVSGLGSGLGRWSNLFAEILYGPRSPILEPELFDTLVDEARELLEALRLQPSQTEVLQRLAEIRPNASAPS